MKEHKIWRQTAVLTCANAITRGAGFVLRVVLSRMLGAQAMGVMTLSHSAHMLFITPVTAGLPLAVSRITARHADARALRAGRSLVLRASAVLIPLWLLLAPLMAYALGDLRVLPSLWVFTPCLAVLGLSAVYNGFCYGLGRAWPPALSEMLEQALRFLLAAGLLLTLPQASVAWRAAMPGVATSIAEAAGLVLILSLLRQETASPPDADYAALRRELWRLSLPLCGMRLLSTALRALSGAMIPRRLVISGLTLAQATAQLGMFQGMVMPVLMAPGIFTGALAMVGAPAVARVEGASQRRLAVRLLSSALICGLGGMAAVRIGANILATWVYNEPELAGMFILSAPLTLLFAVQHAVNALLSGLGEQRQALMPALAGSLLTLALLHRWTALPGARIAGAIRAMQLGQSATLLSTLGLLALALRQSKTPD